MNVVLSIFLMFAIQLLSGGEFIFARAASLNDTYLVEMEGPSMEPTFYSDDKMRVIKIADDYAIQRDDIVIFEKPGYEAFVKRVIGLPGDSIAIVGGVFYINGEQYRESYAIENKSNSDGMFLQDSNESKLIPQDSYFVVGDNRDLSYDSRHMGFIEREWIEGVVVK